jgi:Holliday junction resolvasome RuvABC DNA-binding subunit
MGYTQEEAKQRVVGIDTEGKSVGQLLKDALKK